MIRRLTLSRSKWSRSRILRASARSSLSAVVIAHGSSLTICSQVRMTPYSGLALGIASSRPSSRVASFMTFGGSLAASSLDRSWSISLPPPPFPSPSPSSLRMAFICSWR